jgi:hypothetical protein
VFVFRFQPISAPVDAVYWVAVRSQNPDTAWQILPATDNSAGIAVTPAPSTRRYQIAVLLFDGDPGPLPSHFVVLADTGADFAFVTAPLTPVRSVIAGSESRARDLRTR